MTLEPLYCPYCNAPITLSAEEGAASRVRCPRCGDTFPHRPGVLGAGSLNGDAPSPAGPAAVSALARPRQWPVARVMLGVMAGMALLALAFSLWTQPFRRALDKRKGNKGSPVPTDQAPAATAPADLAGLGYLPPETAVAAGLHLAELLQDPEGKKLWQEVRQGPAGRLLTWLEDRVGLKAEDIDHLVAGVYPTAGLPRAVLVIRTRGPHGQELLARSLASARAEKFRGKPVYRFKVEPVGEALVYQEAENTLIASLSPASARLDDLEAIPRQPRPGAEGLPGAVQECLQKRLDRASLLWVVGAPEHLAALPDFLHLLGRVPEETQTLLAGVKGFSAGLQLEKGLTLRAALRGADYPTARRLAGFLKEHSLPGAESFTVADPSPPGTEDPGGGDWVQVQARIKTEEASRLLARLGEQR